MPDGKTHEKLRVAFSPIIFLEAATLLVLNSDPAPVISLWAGYLAGKYIEPDLDINHTTESEVRYIEDNGFILGKLWAWYWWPYAIVIPHRSPLSHWIGLSTFLRVLYIGAPWVARQMIYGAKVSEVVHLVTQPAPLAFFLGLSQSDAIHIIADVIYSATKRRNHL